MNWAREFQSRYQPWQSAWSNAWNRFWFTPRETRGLGLIRVCTGLIVLYTHLVWSTELSTFFGEHAILPNGYRSSVFEGSSFVWSHLGGLSGSTLWIAHAMGLIIMTLFTLGIFTRATSILTALLVISYANRATGAQFGLDQINCFLCLYLAVGNSGGSYSIDRWWANRRHQTNSLGQGRGVPRCVWTNIAIRLIQVHLCIVYLFAGLGKLQGSTWWNGEAVWGALASYEYQTLDMTWLAHHLWLVNLITLVALVWEASYAILIWPRLTRPIMLALAVPVHLGIGICMGMMEFGLIMLVANLAFIQFGRASAQDSAS